MPIQDGVQRVGAFYCEAEKGNVTEKITNIVMSKNSVITPEFISYTVSVGVSLTLTVNVNPGINSWRWRRNGSLVPPWDNQSTVTINPVTVDDGGIYECHEQVNRTGYQAVFQVIVRACLSNKWGPHCSYDCPICLNGGICDERSGHCVCAPGFIGRNCEIVTGSNRWGQDGELQCSYADNNNGPHTIACHRSLFCRPHPYGCSCAAGFHGIDCDQTPAKIPHITTTMVENILHVDWEPEGSVCLDKKYKVEIIPMVNILSCEDTNLTSETINTTSTFLNVTVKFNTEYVVSITTILNGTHEATTFNNSVTSPVGEPGPVNSFNVSASDSPFELLATWQSSSANNCRENAYNISVQLVKEDQYESMKVWNKTYMIYAGNNRIEFIKNLTDLLPCSRYNVTIIASNSAGTGKAISMLQTTSIAEPGPVTSFNVSPTGSPYELLATWQPSSENNCRETGYNISVQLVIEYQKELIEVSNVINDDTEFVASLTGLLPCSTYNVTIIASNSVGTGKAISILQNTTTLEPVPVTSFNVTETDSPFELIATWQPSSENRCPEIGYSISVQLINEDQNEIIEGSIETYVIVTNNDDTEFEANLPGLLPCSTYNVTIRAFNSAGAGRAISILRSTSVSEPGPVTSFTISVTDSPFELLATWQPSSENNCRETSYIISVQRINEDQNEIIEGSIKTYRIVTNNGYLTGMLPCSTYNVTIMAINSAGTGKAIYMLQYTSMSEPGPVTSFNVSATDSAFELLATWQPSSENNCRETGYSISVQLVNEDQNGLIELANQTYTYVVYDDTEKILTDLLPCLTYNVTIMASNSVGNGKALSMLQNTSTSEPTAPPDEVIASSVTPTSITFSWSEPPCGHRHGPIVEYSYELRKGTDEVIVKSTVSATSITIGDLTSYTNYSLSISAVTNAGEGPAVTLTKRTTQSGPSVPRNIYVEEVTSRSIFLSWEEPKYSDEAIIIGYSIRNKATFKPYDTTYDPGAEPEYVQYIINKARTHNITNLTPSTKYDVKVSARYEDTEGPASVVTQFTNPASVEDIPRPELVSGKIIRTTPTTVEITIPLSTEEFVTSYLIGVELTTHNSKRAIRQFGHYLESQGKYIAAELAKQTVHEDPKFIVGDNGIYGDYFNPPLIEGESYALYIGHVSRYNQTISATSWSEGLIVKLSMMTASYSEITVVVAVSVSVTLLLLVVIIGLVVKNRLVHANTLDQPSRLADDPLPAHPPDSSDGPIQMTADGYTKYKPHEKGVYQGINTSLIDKNSNDDSQGHAYELRIINSDTSKGGGEEHAYESQIIKSDMSGSDDDGAYDDVQQ
ncbi:receptor-type tyrosine-protein phosphatase delta-like [Amphiura filiformis]|uniref:receptor-type tyrosine-protein phosphatase delta-like n=1 Tax=Amphiura filiformis TaxID=82378 RepID=UPI003B21C501